jgi:hypothetical protein
LSAPGGGLTTKKIVEAVEQRMMGPIRGTRVAKILEVAASLSAIILFIGAVLRLSGPLWSILLLIWVCGLATAAFVLLFIQDMRAARRSRYATSVEERHEVSHAIRDAAAAILLRDASSQDVAPHVLRAMKECAVAEMFTIITGARCRACIKEVSRADAAVYVPTTDVVSDLHKLKVTTIGRSGGVPTPADEIPVHYVDQNTDFESLFLQPSLRWFFSNDLTKLEKYKNSSWQGNGPRDYQATCVWPIQMRNATGAGNHEIFGFLCVDSREVGAFDERFDFWVGASIADELYALLKMLHGQVEGVKYVPSGRS